MAVKVASVDQKRASDIDVRRRIVSRLLREFANRIDGGDGPMLLYLDSERTKSIPTYFHVEFNVVDLYYAADLIVDEWYEATP